MAPGQDWCTQCGAGQPGSVEKHPFRPWAIALAATAVLVLGAAAAAYAALSSEPKHAAVKVQTVAQAPPPAAVAPTPTPVPSTPTTTVPPIAKAPKIPTKAIAPPVTVVPPVTTPSAPVAKEPKPTTPATGGSSPAAAKPEPLLLDTDAASTYNPYAYPATSFGDPSLTIDGDPSTGWSAQVNPATAPAMAEGVVIDLKSTKKLSAVKLVTTTPGISLQIYGADVKTAPTSITDPAWTPLSHLLTMHKRHARIGLKDKTKPFRFLVVWISGAPASATGTPEAPGKVTLNEIELFPAS